jgi:ureidoacrylate peracid hydrolase
MKVDPKETALIVVDMQNDFCSPNGLYDRLGKDIEPYRKIIPNVKRLIEVCRKKGITIFFTRATREPSGIDSLHTRHKLLPETRKFTAEKDLCVEGTWGSEIIPELNPKPDDYIIRKRRDSAFQDTPLRLLLTSLDKNILVFSGIDTQICVESTVRDGFNQDFDIIVISDCTASINENFYASSLAEIGSTFGLVLTLKEFINSLAYITFKH